MAQNTTNSTNTTSALQVPKPTNLDIPQPQQTGEEGTLVAHVTVVYELIPPANHTLA